MFTLVDAEADFARQGFIAVTVLQDMCANIN
jgi:hypothetical protein